MLLFTSPDDLFTAAMPGLRQGLDAGNAVILACRDADNALLADALGPHPRLACVSPDGIYTRAAAAAEAYRRMVDQRITAGARRVRVVGEPDFGADVDSAAECSRFEAICNATLARCPLTSTCAYDVGALPERVAADLTAVHPFVLTPTGPVPNGRYVDPATFLRRSEAGPHPVERTSPTAEFGAVTGLHQLAALRDQLRAVLRGQAVRPRIVTDIVAAVQELVVNGLLHGRPPVRVRLWAPSGQLVCTVTDAGSGFDDPLAGYVRAADGDPFGPGVGLWLVRQLCDRIEMEKSVSGFTVRLSTSTRAAD
nr:sensor histidine kinase [Planosporangium thailandense]